MMPRFATPKRAAWVCALALVGAAAPATVGAAPSPEDVRACVEGNLARYSDPSTAVGAQYSDIETTCRAGLEDGSISVQFDPAVSDDPQGAAAGEAGTTTPGTNGGTTVPTPSTGSAADTPDAGGATAATSKPISADATSEELVAEAIAEGDADAGSPLPSSLSGGSAWMIVLLGGAAVAVIGAAALAVRRRLS